MKETKRIRMSDENIASRVKLTLQTFDGRSTEDLMNAIGQHVRNVYESSITKDAELIQSFVDGWEKWKEDGGFSMHSAYEKAIEAGFKSDRS